MNASEIIEDLQRLGVVLWEEDGRLCFRAARGVITDARRELLKLNKQQIIASLRAPAPHALVADPDARHEPFPLTDVQSAYLLGRSSAYGLGGVACHLYVELEFSQLDPARLESAWNALILRHDMLRAVVSQDGSQRILPQVPHYSIPAHDLRECSAEDALAALRSVRHELGHRVHPIGQWPSFELRASLTRETPLLHLSIDFMIADWASIQLLISELTEIHAGRALRELPPVQLSFRDYVLAERRLRDTSRFALDRDYWFARLDELPPAPALPTLPNFASAEPKFGRHSAELSPAQWQSLQRIAATKNLTPSVAVLAAFAEALAHFAQHQEFTLNLTLLNRLPLHPGVSGVVGDFTSINLLAVNVEGESSFEQRAHALAGRLFDDLDHRTFSGVAVLREMARRRGPEAALLPVVFTSAIGSTARGSAALPHIGYGITQTPQVWIDCQVMDHHDALRVNWDFREGVFAPHALAQMFGAFETLLRGLAEDASQWQAASPVRVPPEQLSRRRDANDTTAPFETALLHADFLRNATTEPERLAVIASERSLTYGQLHDLARGLAQQLVTAGCAQGECVAVVMDKGWEQVVAVLGILLAGAAYLPIDTNQPPARRDKVLLDARVCRVVTQPWRAAEWSSDAEVQLTSVTESIPPPPPSWSPPHPATPEQLAYVIYTSGSTGQPKGVMISHRSAHNTILDVNRRFGIHSGDRVLALANLGFDLSVYDVFGTLALGACIVYPDAARRAEPAHWAELISRHSVSVWNSVPAQLQMLAHLLESDPSLALPSLRLALLSGDWIPLGLPKQIHNRLPHLQLISLGGATECSIWSIYHRIEAVDPAWRSIPYGKPLANQSFHVLDSRLQDRPEGVIGELYIGGIGLALGYFGDPDKTAERFVSDPVRGRLYRTGDLGRYLPDGSIEFLGRADQQLKIRGHRVELGEVEAALREHRSVEDAIVVATRANQQLAAFVSLKHGETIGAEQELTRHLSQRLPDYMLPATVQLLDALPVSQNGKVDRKALTALAEGARHEARAEHDPPRGDLEQRLALIWCEVLGITQLGRQQNFFDLGGDSLLAAKLAARVREQIPEARNLFFDSLVRRLLPNPSVAGLAGQLTEEVLPEAPRIKVKAPLLDLGQRKSGCLVVLLHDAAGKLGRYRQLAQLLASQACVVGLSINEAESYLKPDVETLLARRAASYSRMLQARDPEEVCVVAFGAASELGLELSQQLTEAGQRLRRTLLVNGYPVPKDLDPARVAQLVGFETRNVGVLPLQSWPEVDSIAEPDLLRRIFERTLHASAAHDASPYLGEVSLVFTPDAEPFEHATALASWSGRVRSDAELVELSSQDPSSTLQVMCERLLGSFQQGAA
jgi:pyochelin synthetase